MDIAQKKVRKLTKNHVKLMKKIFDIKKRCIIDDMCSTTRQLIKNIDSLIWKRLRKLSYKEVSITKKEKSLESLFYKRKDF